MVLFSYINLRTFVVVALSAISCYLSFEYNLRVHFSIVLLGLAIAFPISNYIQMAFKRREKALEYLALFKSGLLAIHYSFLTSPKLQSDKKAEATKMLNDVADTLIEQLKTSDGNMSTFRSETDKVIAFLERNREEINKRVLIRVVRYLKDTLDGAIYLLSLISHRTIISLRILAIFFINLFAAFHPPMVVYQLRDQMPEWVIYVFCVLGPAMLITLYNVQAQVEYPFDQKGSDDIKLDEFKLRL
jgi:cellobiose-specific phosphotransferase system component IIC